MSPKISRSLVLLLLTVPFATEVRSQPAAGNEGSAARPNLLWIVVEDASPHLGCYGETTIATPHIDRLAVEGVRFRSAIVTNPVCSPSRSAMITGMYQTTLGAHNHRSQRTTGKGGGNRAYYESFGLPIESVPGLFRQAGYHVTNSGPSKDAKTDYNFVAPDLYEPGDWRGRRPDQPFFAQLQLHGGKARVARVDHPVDPLRLTLPPYYPDHPVIRRDWAAYLNSWIKTDNEVGRIVDLLRKEGVLDQTVIFLWTDHGVSHMRGKQFLYEEGIRVPLMVRFGDGSRKGLVRGDLVEHIDIAATSLALAGIERPAYIQGRDLFAENYQPRRYAFSARDRCDETVDIIRCVRSTRWKYIRNFMSHLPHAQPNQYKDGKAVIQTMRRLHREGKLSELEARVFEKSRPVEELYDLENDPQETVNLAGRTRFREQLKKLRGVLYDWMVETRDPGLIPEPILEELGRKYGSKYHVLQQEENTQLVRRLIEVVDAGQRGDRSALLEALESEGASLRYWAASWLGNLGDRSAAEHLTGFTNDPTPAVQLAAALALCKLGRHKQYLPLLAEHIESENLVTGMYAIRALEQLGPAARAVLPAIQRARENPYEFTRRIARRLAVSLAESPKARMLPESTGQGSVRVEPQTGISGQFGSWTVTYTVGSSGIRTKGGIRLQLPDAWHAGPRNSANRLQSTDPAEDHFVSAFCSPDEVRVGVRVEDQTDRALVKHEKVSLDGRSERYVFVVRVVIEDGNLQAGDEIRVVYGAGDWRNRGYRAGAVSTGPLPVLMAVDRDGSGRFRLHADSPRLTLLPGRPVRLQLHAPSNAVVGRPVRLLVSLLDQEENPAHQGNQIDLRVVEGQVEIPSRVQLPPRSGYVELEAIPRAEGIVRVEATSEKWVLSARSNPVRVKAVEPQLKIYWGDLHSHSHFSWDGVGGNNFEYARYVSGLDFYAMTDHSRTPRDGYTRGLSPSTWSEYTGLTETHHDPPHFVTLHAYECSFGTPFGHHNVFFRGLPGPLVAPEDHALPELWDLLVAGQALTIPHHTGKFPRNVDFGIHNPEFRRNFEIYSAHGLSETYDPLHPLAFEHSDFTAPSRSLDHPSHIQDAWRLGLEVSTVAASDDHRAHPGLPHWGLTAVFAPELTRDAIFEALYRRRTYGTTGPRILMDFRVNGTPMGGSTAAAEPPDISIQIIGTDALSRVELLRYQSGGEPFRVIRSWQPDALSFQARFQDTDYQGPATYYVRVRQAMPVRDRLAMAWSSPVWVRSLN